MTETKKIEQLKTIVDYVRTTALGTILSANNGHVGGNLSSVEFSILILMIQRIKIGIEY